MDKQNFAVAFDDGSHAIVCCESAKAAQLTAEHIDKAHEIERKVVMVVPTAHLVVAHKNDDDDC